jgi:CRISPR-associated protein Cas6
MYWQEEEKKDELTVPDTIVDVSYRIKCKQLPLDHAHTLSQALQDALPWLKDEAQAGIHLIHVAESGNGWMRPENKESEVLNVSRRTRMYIRIPKHRFEDAEELSGQTLDIDGFTIEVGQANIKPLVNSSTIFSRYLPALPDESEEQFMQRYVELLKAAGIGIRKLMCGRENEFDMPEGPVFTRSLMLAELNFDDSIKLQQQGLGDRMKQGFGLFIPHKGIAPVVSSED